MFGKKQNVYIQENTKAFKLYGCSKEIEEFRCNYGLNNEFADNFISSGIIISGVDIEQNARIFELKEHPFFMATLFLPQLSSEKENIHPIIEGFFRKIIEIA